MFVTGANHIYNFVEIRQIGKSFLFISINALGENFRVGLVISINYFFPLQFLCVHLNNQNNTTVSKKKNCNFYSF